MSVFSTATRSFTSTYAGVFRPSTATKIHGLTRPAQAGEYVFTANLGGLFKSLPGKIRVTAPVFFRTATAEIGGAILALELVDLFENEWEKHQHRKEMRELLAKIESEGMTEEYARRLHILQRSQTRRTFGQVIRDLPYRTWRRLYRACLFEAGFWLGLLTSPIWLPTVVLDILWSFILVPVAATVMSFFHVDIDVEKAVNLDSKLVQTVLKYTLSQASRLLVKGAAMRLHNRTTTTANNDAYPIIQYARTQAHKTVEKIVDGNTAYEFGFELARVINESTLTPAHAQHAYAQTWFWVEENMASQYRSAVQHGIRQGTPFVYRDITRVPA